MSNNRDDDNRPIPDYRYMSREDSGITKAINRYTESIREGLHYYYYESLARYYTKSTKKTPTEKEPYADFI